MNIEDAIKLAQLWRAGKMIGGDEDDVRDALLGEIERLRASPQQQGMSDAADVLDATRYRRIRGTGTSTIHPEAFIAIRGIGTVAISQLTGQVADEWIDRLRLSQQKPDDNKSVA